ncbi:MAG TPA: hypothetical protein VEA60_07940 [Allosphingosinicella sp.]|nr:hypothetical protein [Allosphingosinicella sp.]
MISDGTTSYTYDVENRLVSASNGVALVYDPLGRLVQASGGAAGTTQFHYEGDKLIAEYNSSGTMLRRYVHGPAPTSGSRSTEARRSESPAAATRHAFGLQQLRSLGYTRRRQ